MIGSERPRISIKENIDLPLAVGLSGPTKTTHNDNS
jgi:hypothetical protein